MRRSTVISTLAILAGLIVSVYLMSLSLVAIAVAIIAFAAVGYWASRGIPRLPAAAPDLELSFNIPRQTLNILRDARANRSVFYSIMGI